MSHGALDLLIIDAQPPAGGQVIAVARMGSRTAIERLPCNQKLDDLLHTRDEIERACLGHGLPFASDYIVDFGSRMVEYLFQNTLGKILSGVTDNHRLTIHILTTHPSFHKVPWEFLYFGGLAGPNSFRPVIRVPQMVAMDPPEPLRLSRASGRKLRILFVAADPNDQTGILWNAWFETVKRQLTQRLGKDFDLVVIPGATLDEFKEQLLGTKFDIFHFAGHGEVDPNGEGILLLRLPNGDTERIPARLVAQWLQPRGIRLAVLTACLTSAGNFQGQFLSTAAALLGAGIGAVVANQFPVPQATVNSFIDGMYKSLLRTGDIDDAVADGRLALQGTLSNASFEWAIPTVYRLFGGNSILVVEP
jgi:CHAT domain